jgi:SseB protein N-terminal domain
MSLLSGGESPFRDDAGSADAQVAATLAAFGAARGSEHAALTALASSRLLVPIVATEADGAADGDTDGAADGDTDGDTDGAADRDAAGGTAQGVADAREHVGAAVGHHRLGEGERGAEMSLPTLIGHDGRAAIPAFTSLESMARWRPAARPVPAQASQVWRAAADDACAVVVDIAGPVPLAIDGARLAALAEGRPVPRPHEDPDVLAAATAAAAGLPAITGLSAAEGGDCDLRLEVTLAAGCDPAAGHEALQQLGSRLMAHLGSRLRRGIEIALTPASSPHT